MSEDNTNEVKKCKCGKKEVCDCENNESQEGGCCGGGCCSD